jgi:hypothetical protein
MRQFLAVVADVQNVLGLPELWKRLAFWFAALDHAGLYRR